MRKIHSIPFSILSFLLFCSLFTGSGDFQTVFQQLKNDPALRHAQLGIHIISPKGDSIFIHHSDASLVPASVLKIVTTAAALEILGADYRYQTNLEYTGTYDSLNGIISGDLLIRGSGDPSFGSGYFRKDSADILEEWAGLLKKKGIKEVKGKVIADASCFEDEMIPTTWIWADMGNYFGAGASGLNYRDNKYTVFFSSGENGSQTKIEKISPYVPGLDLLNKVKAGGSGDNAFIYGAQYNYDHYITGTIPANQKKFDIEGALPDPPFLCGWTLDSLLRNAGIKMGGMPVTSRTIKSPVPAGKPLIVHLSPSLKEIIHFTNRRSVNHFAECLLKTIAKKNNGTGTLSGGCSAITDFWQGKGIDTKGMYMNDGSGLSRWNSVTAAQLINILFYMKSSKNFKTFYESLPEQGANIRAKSGYITRVRSYAGYVKMPNDTYKAFAIILNNYTCSAKDARLKLEKLMEAMR